MTSEKTTVRTVPGFVFASGTHPDADEAYRLAAVALERQFAAHRVEHIVNIDRTVNVRTGEFEAYNPSTLELETRPTELVLITLYARVEAAYQPERDAGTFSDDYDRREASGQTAPTIGFHRE